MINFMVWFKLKSPRYSVITLGKNYQKHLTEQIRSLNMCFLCLEHFPLYPCPSSHHLSILLPFKLLLTPEILAGALPSPGNLSDPGDKADPCLHAHIMLCDLSSEHLSPCARHMHLYNYLIYVCFPNRL